MSSHTNAKLVVSVVDKIGATNSACEKWKSDFMRMASAHLRPRKSHGHGGDNDTLRRLIRDVTSCDVETQIDILRMSIQKSRKHVG